MSLKSLEKCLWKFFNVLNQRTGNFNNGECYLFYFNLKEIIFKAIVILIKITPKFFDNLRQKRELTANPG